MSGFSDEVAIAVTHPVCPVRDPLYASGSPMSSQGMVVGLYKVKLSQCKRFRMSGRDGFAKLKREPYRRIADVNVMIMHACAKYSVTGKM